MTFASVCWTYTVFIYDCTLLPEHRVVRGGDSSIDSYIVPLLCIGQREQH